MTSAAALEPFADEVWVATRPQRFWGIETGTRMTVVRLEHGGLLVHCPVALDPATRAEVDALGPVTAIVASSLYHHLYAGDWAAAYPRAILAAAPGLRKKRPDLRVGHVLGDTPHPLWQRELEQVYLSARFEHEVVFFHPRSRTSICADALLNLRDHPSRRTRLVARCMGNTAPGKGWLERFAVGDRRTARAEIDRVLAWDVDRIVLAHGSLVLAGGRRVWRDAYAWVS